MLDRVKLNRNQRRILWEINKSYKEIDFGPSDEKDIVDLEIYGLILHVYPCKRKIDKSYLTSKGKLYLKENPKLKNPSIWQDSKFIIATIISIVSLLISAFALYFSLR